MDHMDVVLVDTAVQASTVPTNQQLRDSHKNALKTVSELFATALDGNLQLDALQRELELWKASYMQAERAKTKLEQEVTALKGDGASAAGPPFTAILIDGDGAIFNESFICQGAVGGAEAAKLLLSSLPQIIQSAAPHLAKSKALTGNVVINVVVNKYGLAGALFKAGLIRGVGQLNEFLLGLCKSHDMLNVIDAGPGKEASDSKIMAQLRFYGGISQCGLIVLAGSHDNGYANPLRSLITQGKDIVMLEGIPVAAELIGLIPVATVPGLLRKEKIKIEINASNTFAGFTSSGTSNVGGVAVTKASRTGSKLSPIAKASRETREPNGGDASEDYTDVSDDADDDEVEEIDFETFDASRTTKSSKPSNTSSTVIKNNDSLQQHLTTTTNDKDTLKKKKVAKKAAAPVSDAKVSIPADEKALRYLNPRPCHKHYLTQSGCDNKSCTFGHDYTLNNKQLMYLAKLVKDMPCPFAKLGRCTETVETCVYGHRCPYYKDCTWGANCRFNDLPGGGHESWVLY